MFREAVEVLRATRPAGAQLILSIGPDFGKAMDQAGDIRRAEVANVMLLPMFFPADPRGVAEGVRRIADRLGYGIVLYVKRENYVAADDLARLVVNGEVRFVKYAVERPDPASDTYLDSLIAAIGRERIASGMGETPVIDHIGRRRLVTYTSGAVCIAPAAVMRCSRIVVPAAKPKPGICSRRSSPRARAPGCGTAVLHDAITPRVSPIAVLMPLSNLDATQKAKSAASLRCNSRTGARAARAAA